MSKGEIIAESAVRFVRSFDASPAKVWAFLTDSALLPQWYGDGQIEPREGGKISLMAGHIRGVVTGWRPEKFLGYTWSIFQPGEDTASNSEAVGQTKSPPGRSAIWNWRWNRPGRERNSPSPTARFQNRCTN